MNQKALLHRLLFVICIVLFKYNTQAQSSIIAITPPNDFRFEDLWNVTVNKDASVSYNNYYINLKVYNTNGLLIDVQTKDFTITTSPLVITPLNLASISPFTYSYQGSSVLEGIINRGGLFPAGEYQFVYKLLGNNNGTITELAEHSNTHVVVMPAFLQLVTVFDKDSIKEDNPTFMWLPASATRTIGNYETLTEYKLTYTISIAEVLTNQTPYMAITSNPKFFHQEGLENTLLTYPISARRFEPCKTYAWQVKGVINNQTVISSEIWTFNTVCKKEEIVPSVPVLVKREADLATCYVVNNSISFSYFEEYAVGGNTILNAQLFNSKNVLVADAMQLDLPVKIGYNTYTLNTCPSGANILNGETYSLVITNQKNEKWYLKIINNQTTNTCY